MNPFPQTLNILSQTGDGSDEGSFFDFINDITPAILFSGEASIMAYAVVFIVIFLIGLIIFLIFSPKGRESLISKEGGAVDIAGDSAVQLSDGLLAASWKWLVLITVILGLYFFVPQVNAGINTILDFIFTDDPPTP